MARKQLGSAASNPEDAVTKAGLDGKAPLASPALTGNPTAPTQSPGTGNTRIATTAYADAAANAKVADAINDGATAIAPSQNAVFDALAGKVSGDGTVTDVRVVTQAAYNALGSGRPSTRYYIIVG